MNQSRSYRKLFRRRTIQDILPQRPVEFAVEPWYMLHSGCILDADIRVCVHTLSILQSRLYLFNCSSLSSKRRKLLIG